MVLHDQSTAEEKVIYRVNPLVFLMPAFQLSSKNMNEGTNALEKQKGL